MGRVTRTTDENPGPLRCVVCRHSINHDVIKYSLCLFILCNHNQTALFGFRFAGYVVDNNVGDAEVRQPRKIAANYDAVGISAGYIEVVNLPILLIVQLKSRRVPSPDDTWQSADPKRSQANGF